MTINVDAASLAELMKDEEGCWACTAAYHAGLPIGSTALLGSPGQASRVVSCVEFENMFFCVDPEEANSDDAPSTERD